MSSEAPVEICRRRPRIMPGVSWRAHYRTECCPYQYRAYVPQKTACHHSCFRELRVAPVYCNALKLDTAEETLTLEGMSVLFRSH